MARPRSDGSPSTAPNRQRLSHFAVKNLKPRERPYTVWNTVQHGFGVAVQPSGHAAWKTVYSYQGRPLKAVRESASLTLRSACTICEVSWHAL